MTSSSDPSPAQIALRRSMQWLRDDTWRFRFWPALFGAGIAVALLSYVNGAPVHVLDAEDWFYLVLAALGGAFGGYLMSGWIGRPGPLGVLLTLLGCWLAGGLGGAFAGTIFAPIYGTFFGAMVGAFLPLASFAAGVIWLICCAVLHLIMGQLRPSKDMS